LYFMCEVTNALFKVSAAALAFYVPPAFQRDNFGHHASSRIFAQPPASTGLFGIDTTKALPLSRSARSKAARTLRLVNKLDRRTGIASPAAGIGVFGIE
jgi:hypothetical protein